MQAQKSRMEDTADGDLPGKASQGLGSGSQGLGSFPRRLGKHSESLGSFPDAVSTHKSLSDVYPKAPETLLRAPGRPSKAWLRLARGLGSSAPGSRIAIRDLG